MKVTFTFEYADLLEQVEKTLSMSGVKALKEANGNKQIYFDHKKKEVVVHCEAAPLPDACPFCSSGLQEEVQIQDKSQTNKTSSNDDDDDTTQANTDDSQTNTDDSEENTAMSLSALRAQSSALAAQKPTKLKVATGAEAHAALAEPEVLVGESGDPPAPGEGGE